MIRIGIGIPIIKTYMPIWKSDDLAIADAEIVVSNEDASSNLNGVADADAADDDVIAADDDIDNAKSPPECKNLIRDLDGIQDNTIKWNENMVRFMIGVMMSVPLYYHQNQHYTPWIYHVFTLVY